MEQEKGEPEAAAQDEAEVDPPHARSNFYQYLEEFAHRVLTGKLDLACTQEAFERGGLWNVAKVTQVVRQERDLNDYADESHKANIKWWQDPATGALKERNFGELIALCHSELSEALEGHRKGLMDDKVPWRLMAEVELADLLIRVFDLAAAFGYDLEGAYRDKAAYNATRKDHTHEARLAPGGKAY